MSILVIDDEPGLRRSLCAYLEDRDFDMLEAANGKEGLALLEMHLHSLEAVIVDLNMPVMDGYSFIQEAVARTKELPSSCSRASASRESASSFSRPNMLMFLSASATWVWFRWRFATDSSRSTSPAAKNTAPGWAPTRRACLPGRKVVAWS